MMQKSSNKQPKNENDGCIVGMLAGHTFQKRRGISTMHPFLIYSHDAEREKKN
jgi:hypothetical protein